MSVTSSRWRSKQSVASSFPRPSVEIRDSGFSNTSIFAGDVIGGINSVFVRTPDFDNAIFAAENEPLLELGWYRRRVGTGEGREGSVSNNGLAFPDDATLKFGSDQGGGHQMNQSGDNSMNRRSKWDVSGAIDFEHITGQRIELEHYFKIQPVSLLTTPTTWPVGPDAPVLLDMPVPTFLPPCWVEKPQSNSAFDVERTTPRYHGQMSGYFQFRFSIKDHQGAHAGDRIHGPLSKTIQIRAAAADGGFPIWPTPSGWADGEDAAHIKAFII